MCEIKIAKADMTNKVSYITAKMLLTQLLMPADHKSSEISYFIYEEHKLINEENFVFSFFLMLVCFPFRTFEHRSRQL